MRQPQQQPQMPPRIKTHGNLGVQRSLGAHVPVGDRLGKRSPLGRRRLGVHSLGRGFSSAFVGGGRSQPGFRPSSASERLSAQLSEQGNIRQGEASTGNPTQNSASKNSAANRKGGSSSEGNGLRGKLQAETLPESPLGRFSSEVSASRSIGAATPARSSIGAATPAHRSIGAATPAHLGQNLMRQANSRLSTPLGSQLNGGLTTPSDSEGVAPQTSASLQNSLQNSASSQNSLAPVPSLQLLSQPSESAFGPAFGQEPGQRTPANDPEQSTGKPTEKNKGNKTEKNSPQSSFAPSSALPNSTNSGDTLPNSTPSGSVLPNSTLPKSTQAAATAEFSSQDSGGSLPAQPLGQGLSNIVQRTLALAQKLQNQPLSAGKSARDRGGFPLQQSDRLANGNPGSRVNSNKPTTGETSRKTAASLQPLDTLVEKVTDTISTVSRAVVQKSSAAERNTIANGAAENEAVPQDGSGNGASAVEGTPSARRPLGMNLKGRTVQRKPLGSALTQPLGRGIVQSLQRKTLLANAPQPSPSPAPLAATNLPVSSAPATSNRPSSAVGDLIQRQAAPQAQNSTVQNSTAQNSTVQNSTAQNSTAQNSTAQPTTAAPSPPVSQAPTQQTQPAKSAPKQNQPIQAKTASQADNAKASVTSTDAASQASPSSVPQQPRQPVVQRQETPASNPSQPPSQQSISPSQQSISTEGIQNVETPGNTAQPSAVQAKHDSSAPFDSAPFDSSLSDNASARISDLVQRQADSPQQPSSAQNSSPQLSWPTVQRQVNSTTPQLHTPSPKSTSTENPSTENSKATDASANTSTQSPTVRPTAQTALEPTVQAKQDSSIPPDNASARVGDLVQRQVDDSQQQSPLLSTAPQPSQPTVQRQVEPQPASLRSPAPQNDLPDSRPRVETPANTTSQPSTVQAKQDSPGVSDNTSAKISDLVQRQADNGQQQSSLPSTAPQASQPTVQRQVEPQPASLQSPAPQNDALLDGRLTAETPANRTSQPSTVQAKQDSPGVSDNTSAKVSDLVQRQADNGQQQSSLPSTAPQASQPTVQRQVEPQPASLQSPAPQNDFPDSRLTAETPANTTSQPSTVQAKQDSPGVSDNTSAKISALVQRQADNSQQQSSLPSTAPQASQPTVQRQADSEPDSPQSSSFQNTSTESFQNTEIPDSTSAQPLAAQASTVQASTVQAKSDSPTVPVDASNSVSNLVQRQADSSQQQPTSPSHTPQPSQPAAQRQIAQEQTIQRQADSANSSSQSPAVQNISTESFHSTETLTNTAAQLQTVEAKHDATITRDNASERAGNLVQRQVDSNLQQSPAPSTLPQSSQPVIQRQADATANPSQSPDPQSAQQAVAPADAVMRSPTPEAKSDTPDAPSTASDRIGDLVQRQADSTQPKSLPSSSTPQPSQPTVQRQATPADSPQTNSPQQNLQSTVTSTEPANPADRSDPSAPSAPSQKVQAEAASSAMPPSLQRSSIPSSADEPTIERKAQAGKKDSRNEQALPETTLPSAQTPTTAQPVVQSSVGQRESQALSSSLPSIPADQSPQQPSTDPSPSSPSPSAATVQRQAAPPSDTRESEPSESTVASPASPNRLFVQRQREASEPNTSTKSLLPSRSKTNTQDAISPNLIETTAAETTVAETASVETTAAEMASVENVAASDHDAQRLPTTVQRQADTSELTAPTAAKPAQQDATPEAQKLPSQPSLPSQSSPPTGPSPTVQRKSAAGENPVLAQPHLASQEASSAQPSTQTVQRQDQNAETQDTARPTIQAKATTSPTNSPSQSETTPNSRQQDTPATAIDSSAGLPTASEPAVQRQATVQRRFSSPDFSGLSSPTSVVELADQISSLPEDVFPEDIFPEDSELSDLLDEPSVLDIAELIPEKDDIRSAVQAATETVEKPSQPSVSAEPNNQLQAQNTAEAIPNTPIAPEEPVAQAPIAPIAPRTSIEQIVNQAVETLLPDLSQGETIAHEVIQKLNALPTLSPQKPLGPRTISKRFTELATAPQPLEALLSTLSKESTSQPDRAKSSWQADALSSSPLAATLPELSNGTGLEKVMALAQSAVPGIGQAMDAASAAQAFLPSPDNGSDGDWESQFDLQSDLQFDLKSLTTPKDASKQEPWAKQFKFDSQVEPKSDLQAPPGKQSQNSGPGDSLDRVNQEDTENPTDIAAGEVIKSQNTDFANEPTDSELGDEETRESEGTKATNAGRFDTKPEEKVDDEKMELLARKFYQLLRLRLDDERNSHSNIFSGAAPWADIITFPLVGDSKSEAPKVLQKDTEAPSLEMDRKVNDLIEALYQHILSQSLAERTSEGWFYPK